MLIKRRLEKNKMKNAASILEYLLVLAIVTLAFVTMNVYIKRHLQQRYKDMTDYFISNQQEMDVSLKANLESATNSTTYGILNEYMDYGGRTRTRSIDEKKVQYNQVYAEEGYAYESPLVGGKSAYTGYNNSQYTNSSGATAYSTSTGNQAKLSKASDLRSSAAQEEAQGNELISRANEMECSGDSTCEQSRTDLMNSGQDLLAQAESDRISALQLEQEASQ